MHPLLQLAKDAVEAYVREGRIISPPPDLPPEAQRRAGVFVSIKSAEGDLRGCIGTTDSTQDNVAVEVIHYAIRSASEDPRYPPVAPEELAYLSYSVDVLATPQPVFALDQLDPQRYGILVCNGDRRGVLLPALDGVDTTAKQLAIALTKAGLLPDEPVELWRFQVERYS